MHTIAPKWRQLGIALGFDSSDLDTIEATCRDVLVCSEKLFCLWTQKGENYSWRGLLTALEDADFLNLTKDLRTALDHLSS